MLYEKDTIECSEYLGIPLVAHARKVLLKVVSYWVSVCFEASEKYPPPSGTAFAPSD